MKRILLILCLFYGVLGANENVQCSSDNKKWNTFFGVEGGVGLTNYYRNYFTLVSANQVFSESNGSAVGYHIALNLGWQKFLSENIGTRLSLNLGGEYIPQIKIKNNGINLSDFSEGYGWEFSFVNDWIFNFISHSELKFGILLGFALDFYDHIDFREPSFSSMDVFLLNARLGFSTQIENNVVDLYFSIPAISLIPISNKLDGKYYLHYTNALTLGYKYLF